LIFACVATRQIGGGSAMKRCAWCQEMSDLVPVVNRDPHSSHAFDLVCLACAEVERFEHADEVIWNPLGFTPTK